MDAALLTEAGYAIGLGLIVGLEREHSEVASGLADGAIPAQTGRAPLQPAAGVRTLGLFGLVGWLLAYLGGSWPWLLPVGLLAVAAMVSVQIAVSRDTGITTEVAALVVLLLGAVVRFDRGLAVALALATTALLVSKGWVRGFVVKLRRVELTATLQLLILVAIVLPLLPVEARDPWGALPPRKVGTFVVLIAAVQYVGYVLTRWLGAARGVGLAGLVGGLTSSTAVTVSMAKAAKDDPGMVGPGLLATFLANLVMPIRVVAIAWAIAPEVGARTALALAPMVVVLLIAAGLAFARVRREPPVTATAIELKNPFALWGALAWGAVLCGVLLAAHLATAWLGQRGLYLAAALSGITDVDAITLAAADQARGGVVDPAWAALAIAIAAIANTIAKGLMAYLGGGRAFGRRVAGVFAIAAAVTAAAAGVGVAIG